MDPSCTDAVPHDLGEMEDMLPAAIVRPYELPEKDGNETVTDDEGSSSIPPFCRYQASERDHRRETKTQIHRATILTRGFQPRQRKKAIAMKSLFPGWEGPSSNKTARMERAYSRRLRMVVRAKRQPKAAKVDTEVYRSSALDVVDSNFSEIVASPSETGVLVDRSEGFKRAAALHHAEAPKRIKKSKSPLSKIDNLIHVMASESALLKPAATKHSRSAFIEAVSPFLVEESSGDSVEIGLNMRIPGNTVVKFVTVNPKKGKSALHFEKYRRATTARELKCFGATNQDIEWDVRRKFMWFEPEQLTYV